MTGGPLRGVRIVEFAGLGPAPFCAMLLADMGADVVRIDRPGADYVSGANFDLTMRGRRSVALDLKDPAGLDRALALMDRADAVIEGFRPGVMERLGLGPETALARNCRLVYARMTGWGQDGPLAQAAGHDINYIALTGALHAIGRKDSPPPPPLNLLGDYGGGAMFLLAGILAGLIEARSSGQGQVVDCAIVDGVANLLAPLHGMLANGSWSARRQANLVDGGAPFYDCYECADGAYVAIGPVEPHFYEVLLDRAGLAADPRFAGQYEPDRWEAQRDAFTALFRTRSREEWCNLLEGSDACFAPVLDWDEAPRHPHNVARGSFVTVGGVTTGAPAPRFSRTPSHIADMMAQAGEHTQDVLRDWGVAR